MEDAPAVILDCGSTLCRAGFSNDMLESPSIIIPNILGRPRFESPNVKCTPFIGETATKLNRDEHHIMYPIQYGHVTDWDGMQLMWQALIDDKLKIRAADHPFLLVQPCNVSSYNLEKTAEIFFEIFDAPSLCLMPSGKLSLLASAIETGIAVEIGGGACFCVPVINGYGMRHLQQRTEFSGTDIASTLSAMIAKNSNSASGHGIPFDVINSIKERYCFCVKNYAEECDLFSKEHEIVHDFTDGRGDTRSVTIGIEQFQCPESLFKPGLAKKEFPGLHEIVSKCLSVEDDNLKNELASNILLCGGSSLFPGLTSRLQSELEILPSAKECKHGINVVLSPFRHAAFQGGKVFSSSANFLKHSMSKEYYDENGPYGITNIFRQ